VTLTHCPTTLPKAGAKDGAALSRGKGSVLPICVIGCYWVVLIYYLGAQWSVYEQYGYGWAVPFLCAYLLWGKTESRKQKAESRGGKSETLKSLGQKAEISGQWSVVSGPVTQSPVPFSFSAFQLFSFFLLAFLYAPTRFLHEANPIWRLTSLLWALEVIGLTLVTVRLVLGASTHRSSDFRLRASDFTFPIGFFLLAVPWPSGLETFVTQSLMRLNSATTVELLGLYGVPALQHGNVIEVGSGMVGIEEACSGIRSIQAALMLSLFFGEVYRLTIRRRVWLVLLGFALAFLFNVGRTLLLTQIASAKGIGAVASWHDPAGVTILVACFLSIWLLALGGKAEILKAEMLKSEAEKLNSALQRFQFVSVSVCQRFSICLIAWLLFVEAGTELWYRSHEHSAAIAPEWSVNLDDAEPAVTKVETPPNIRGQFNADRNLQGRWQDSSGNAWQLYYFRWLPADSLKRRVAIQLAKVHGPEICLPAAGMTLESYLGVITVPLGNTVLALQQYLFTAEGKPIHVFYGIYEDPTGSAVLANRRQNTTSRIKAALAGSRNSGQRFLELAVSGYGTPEDAKAAVTRELQKLIKVEK
jgi:exosortase